MTADRSLTSDSYLLLQEAYDVLKPLIDDFPEGDHEYFAEGETRRRLMFASLIFNHVLEIESRTEILEEKWDDLAGPKGDFRGQE